MPVQSQKVVGLAADVPVLTKERPHKEADVNILPRDARPKPKLFSRNFSSP